MTRAPRQLAVLAALVAVLATPGDALAARAWDRATPTDLVGGLEAVAAHPTDPKIWWVSDGARVWATDDGGDSFGLVLRATGAKRFEREAAERRDDQERRRVAPDTSSSSSEDAFVDSFTATVDTTLAALAGDDESSQEESPRPSRRSRIRATGRARIGEIVQRVGSRLRLIGDRIFLCGAVGLWSAEASARTLGTDREHRFGRSIPVFDVAEDRHGKRWVATSEGLFVLQEGDRAMPTRGNASKDPVLAMQPLGRFLVGGNTDGLWIGDGHYIVRLGLLSGASMPLDVLALDDTRVAVATGNEVWFVSFPEDGTPRVDGRWPVAGASRLAMSADGKLLAAGPMGLWVEEEPGQWTRSAEGMSDRRLRDVAGPAPGGDAISLVVSRAGSFRYITELAKLQADRGRAAMGTRIEGASTSRDVVLAGYAMRQASVDRVRGWRLSRSLAFLLPEIRLSYQSFRRRYEQGLLVDALDKVVLTDVRVTPGEDEIRVFASWDLYPLLFANPDFDTAYGSGRMSNEIRRVLDDRIEVQETVVPLYNRWVESRVKGRTHEFADTRAALKAEIARAHLEADLHALTGGAFYAPPPIQSSTSRSDKGEYP
jgi:hypothetical protein